MGAVKVNVINEQLLNIEYSNRKNIRMLLKNWSNLERLSEKGDAVAICVLLDLKNVTGIDPSLYDKTDAGRKRFEEGRKKGILTYNQFIAVAYTLVLGYNQSEVAYMLDLDQSGLSRHINRGITAITTVLGRDERERKKVEDKKKKRG